MAKKVSAENKIHNSGTIQVQRQVQYVPSQGRNFVEPKTRAGRRKISWEKELCMR
jgi:hypothetical protein